MKETKEGATWETEEGEKRGSVRQKYKGERVEEGGRDGGKMDRREDRLIEGREGGGEGGGGEKEE